jgi:hypothetical protein
VGEDGIETFLMFEVLPIFQWANGMPHVWQKIEFSASANYSCPAKALSSADSDYQSRKS